MFRLREEALTIIIDIIVFLFREEALTIIIEHYCVPPPRRGINHNH